MQGHGNDKVFVSFQPEVYHRYLKLTLLNMIKVELDVASHACHPNTCKTQAGGSAVQGKPHLLGSLRLVWVTGDCLKNKTECIN